MRKVKVKTENVKITVIFKYTKQFLAHDTQFIGKG